MAMIQSTHSTIQVREIPSGAPMGGPSSWELEIIIPMGGTPWISGDRITIQGMGNGGAMQFEVHEVSASSADGSQVRAHRVR